MSLPNVEEVRNRIESIPFEEIQLCLKATYLFAARISEVISKSTPKDTTTPRGQLLTTQLNKYKRKNAAVFRVATAKRGGIIRLVALPLNPQYEPWTQQVYDYLKEHRGKEVFPFTRQKAWRHAKNAFEGLTYPIEKYVVFKKNGELKKKPIAGHERKFRLHALRHLRASELVEVYGFNGIDLSTYGGWTLQRSAGLPSVMQRYLTLSWQSYFPKLLRKRL